MVQSDAAAGYLAAARRLPRGVGRTGRSSTRAPSRPASATTARPTASRWEPTPAASGTTRTLFAQAGLPGTWQPKTWDDVLERGRDDQGRSCPTSSRSTSTPASRRVRPPSMQGFEMLLYGTDGHALRHDEQKWVVGSQGLHGLAQLHRDRLHARSSARRRSRPSTPTSAQRVDRVAARRASSPSRSTAPGWPAAGSSRRHAVARVERDDRHRRRCPPRTARRPERRHVGRLDPRHRRQRREQGRRVRLHRDRPQQGELPQVRRREQPDRRAHRRRRGPGVPRRQPDASSSSRARRA